MSAQSGCWPQDGQATGLPPLNSADAAPKILRNLLPTSKHHEDKNDSDEEDDNPKIATTILSSLFRQVQSILQFLQHFVKVGGSRLASEVPSMTAEPMGIPRVHDRDCAGSCRHRWIRSQLRRMSGRFRVRLQESVGARWRFMVRESSAQEDPDGDGTS